MCRLLYVKSDKEFDIAPHLLKFSEISKNSKEYQGHGWGCSFLFKGDWSIYKSVKPIWDSDLNHFGKTKLLIAHARSAFNDYGIDDTDNNMPFYDNKYMFAFNGELRGVKIKEKGCIGAEKIFNYIKRFDKGDMFEALNKAIPIIKKKTRYLKAMNIIMSDKSSVFVSSTFSEDPDYFTLHYKKTKNNLIICSEPYSNENGWEKFPEGRLEKF